MNVDFSELTQYLDEKFEKIDTRFVEIDQKLNKIDEEKADKKDINNLLTAIDAYAKKADTYF